MIKNYSLKDAFKALDEINDDVIETSIVFSGPLNEDYNELKEDIDKSNIRVYDIEWETDGEDVDLPSEIYLKLDEDELSEDDEVGTLHDIIADKLSDETGWLVNYFSYEKLDKKDTFIESKKLTEEIFSLSDEEGIKDIEEFKDKGDKEVPEIKIVDVNANDIDEVASNDDVAGSFVFTCDKCGEHIFRTLDELKDAGYEKLDDSERSQFKLRNKNISDGEFYRCTRCGGQIWNGDKQIVLADVDKEVTGEEEIKTEPDSEEIVVPEPEREEIVDKSDDVVIESLKEDVDVTDDDIAVDYLSDRIAKVLDNAGILYGDIVDYGKSCHLVGIDESEWEEAAEAIRSELNLRVEIPAEDHEELDDELIVYEESLNEYLSSDNLIKFKEHDFFKDFAENSIRKFISIYLDFNGGSDKTVTPDEVYQFMNEEGLGVFALDNFDALRFLIFKQLVQKDPKFIEACKKYYPEAFENDDQKWLEHIFKEIDKRDVNDVINDIKKIYISLDEALDDNQESGDDSSAGDSFDDKMDFLAKDEDEAIDGYKEVIPSIEDEHVKDQLEKIKTEEEAHKEYLEKVKEDHSIDYVEPLESGEEIEDEYADLTITDIDEISLDEAISNKLKEMFENFASYKTESAILKDVENRIILEGNLTFTSNKKQKVNLILEAIESDNNDITFKLLSEDFKDIDADIITTLTEGLLEAKKKVTLSEGVSADDPGVVEAYAFLENNSDGYAFVTQIRTDKGVNQVNKGFKSDADLRSFLKEFEDDIKTQGGEVKDISCMYQGQQGNYLDVISKKESVKEDINSEDAESLEEYCPDDISNIDYHIKHYNMFNAEEISESDLEDYKDDADGYIVNEASLALWDASTSNEGEKSLILDYIERTYPNKVKLLRKLFGNEYSSVKPLSQRSTYIESK